MSYSYIYNKIKCVCLIINQDIRDTFQFHKQSCCCRKCSGKCSSRFAVFEPPTWTCCVRTINYGSPTVAPEQSSGARVTGCGWALFGNHFFKMYLNTGLALVVVCYWSQPTTEGSCAGKGMRYGRCLMCWGCVAPDQFLEGSGNGVPQRNRQGNIIAL